MIHGAYDASFLVLISITCLVIAIDILKDTSLNPSAVQSIEFLSIVLFFAVAGFVFLRSPSLLKSRLGPPRQESERGLRWAQRLPAIIISAGFGISIFMLRSGRGSTISLILSLVGLLCVFFILPIGALGIAEVIILALDGVSSDDRGSTSSQSSVP